MKRVLLVLLLVTVGCDGADPPPPPRVLSQPAPDEMTPRELEELQLDVEVALREIEIEVERLEEEWEPEKSFEIAQLHEEDITALRARILKIEERLEDAKDDETTRFRRFRLQTTQRLSEFDERLDVIEAALAHAALRPRPRSLLPSVF